MNNIHKWETRKQSSSESRAGTPGKALDPMASAHTVAIVSSIPQKRPVLCEAFPEFVDNIYYIGLASQVGDKSVSFVLIFVCLILFYLFI